MVEHAVCKRFLLFLLNFLLKTFQPDRFHGDPLGRALSRACLRQIAYEKRKKEKRKKTGVRNRPDARHG